MSISMIRSVDTQGLTEGARRLSEQASRIDETIGAEVRAVRELEAGWKGEAATAARGSAYRTIEKHHLLHEIIAALANALGSGANLLQNLRITLLTWVDMASNNFYVSDAGVVTVKEPNTSASWVAIAAQYTIIIQKLIQDFLRTDRTLADRIKAISAGHIPDNDPGTDGGIDPDSLNSSQLTWVQELAGGGDPESSEAGVGNTDLSLMGMTPDGRFFTIQGDTSDGMNPLGGPADPRLPDEEGGRNNIIFWKMDEHGNWVVDEVVKGPFKTDGQSTIPTSTFNVGDTMYASVMDVKNWKDGTWQTGSSQLWKSTDNGRTWQPTNAIWPNTGTDHGQPFQVQSFAPRDDGYVYVYGTQDGRENDGLRVARVPVNAIEDPSQYQYWTGTGFDTHQDPTTSPPVLKAPVDATGVGEPNVHFYENKALLTFTDDTGRIYTSSSTDGANWTPPQLVTDQPHPGVYGFFQSPFSGGNSIDATLSNWNPYGTNIYRVQNSDTAGLGAY
ncbi:hypothetical protein A5761_19230 [Mycolicibacterium setense]|uniref:DUF4185 domain-containing protein n=1 Tax=Mycolicibacterium setense TaxID=431269 RepID=UPI0007EA361A|nr:DUF4185 domain-containing protein [Mycolicibacterium setense]OBB13766.1 hypothetical protein A5761_19230 [Mycolicibacterium setense]